jgi:hypothetical protein
MIRELAAKKSLQSLRPRTSVFLAALVGIFIMSFSQRAEALPSFAMQTGQPCQACHVGAFGPQLKPFGRDFKLYGYVNSDEKPHQLPIAAMFYTSFTHTKEDQAAPLNPSPLFGDAGNQPNNNFELDQASLYYAGRITPTVGGFVQVTYSGVSNSFNLDNADIRHSFEGSAFGKDYVAGFTFNNAPSMADLWNSTPIWGFPYNGSSVAPGPYAATIIDAGQQGSVAGVGSYMMYNDWVYLEGDMYKGLGAKTMQLLEPPGEGDAYPGPIPYGKIAIQHDIHHNYFELGTYGISTAVYPGGDMTHGRNRLNDIALDANYQYTGDMEHNMISAHSTLIHENLNLGSSFASGASSNPSDTLNTFRADVTYAHNDTWVPTVQFFQTWGSQDANYYGLNNSTGSASPNSRGYVAELAYVPLGKPDSFINWGNARLALQYTGYTEFDGTHTGASNNNTIYLNLWIAFTPFR